MKIKVILSIAATFILVNTGIFFGQEPSVNDSPSHEALPQGAIVPDTQNEMETQWIWGEVVSLDAQNKAVTVKYLDYETDQEKEIAITADDQTTFENIKALNELKPKDAVSIDYMITLDGKNIAKTISLEQPDSAPVSSSEAMEQSPNQENAQSGNAERNKPAPLKQ